VLNPLKETYGYCIIPKGTLLYRGHTEAIQDCMFFATKKWVAGAFYEQVQIWKTRNDIEVLFLVDSLDERSWAKSAIPQLYQVLFPEEKSIDLTDLDIKHRNSDRLNKLVHELFVGHEISGWLSSIEGKVEMEVCLFDKETNESHLQLLTIVDRNDVSHFKDSLNSIHVFPSPSFYDRSIQKFIERGSVFSNSQDTYKVYKSTMNAWIHEEVQMGMDWNVARHFHFNLRLKLKI
jgi:hypothetical protein